MPVLWEGECAGRLRLRAVPHWCPKPGCASEATFLAGALAEDRWFAFADGRRALGVPDDEFYGIVAEVTELDEVALLEHILPGFGLPWGAISPVMTWAMCSFLESAPADFTRELLWWEPADLRGLREDWVEGGMESFVRALRTMGRYRRSGEWDRRVPLKGGGVDG